jgi:hypothetical protein
MYPHFSVYLAVVRHRELRAHSGQFGHIAPPRARESDWPKRRSMSAARRAALSAVIAASLIGGALMAVANREFVDDASSDTTGSSLSAVYDLPVPDPTAQVVIDSTSFIFRSA